MVKNYVFLGVFAFTSWLFWLFTGFWLNAPSLFSSPSVFVWPLAFFIFLISLLVLAFLLVGKRFKLWFPVALFGSFLLIFGYNNLYLGAFALAFLAQFLAINRFNSEKEERLKLNIKAMARRGVPFIVTSFLILISFGYFLTPAVQMSAESQEVSKYLERAVRITVDIVAKNGGEVGEQARVQAESKVLSRLDDLFSPYYIFLPPFLAFGLFLLLQGFSFVFLWLAVALSVLLFWTFKKIGIIKIEIVNKEAEIIKF